MNPVLEGIKYVAERSKQVNIDTTKLKEVSSNFSEKDIKPWTDMAPFTRPKLNDEDSIAYNLVFCSINVCYWGDPKWTIEYQDKKLDGAWGQMAALYRAVSEGYSILDPNYLETLSEKDLSHILRGNTQIPLFNERLNALKEVGRVINEKYEGKCSNLVKSADQDALKLLEIITADFQYYDDSTVYNGRKVMFHKKAQLAIWDISRSLDSKGLGFFSNIDELTAFAEYKIPQSLRKLGILKYSHELAEKVDNKIELKKDCPEEIEIRAGMVWAIELMKNEIKPNIPKITSEDIDNYLWLKGQTKSPDDKPYHRVRTIFY